MIHVELRISTLGVIGLFIGPFLMALLFWWLRGGHVDTVENTVSAAPEK